MYIMAKSKNANKENDNADARSPWKEEEDVVLVEELKIAKKAGKQAQNGWLKKVWTDCEERMKKDFPDHPKSAVQCQEHFNSTLKKNFKAVYALVTKGSGWGWDPVRKHVTATDEEHPDRLEVVGDTDVDQGNTTDIEQESPRTQTLVQTPVPSRKRTRAPSETPEPFSSASCAPKSRGNAEAGDNVADAIRGLYSVMKDEPPASVMALSTPERRKAAVELMEEDGELSETEEVLALQLFSHHKEAADTFLSTKKKTLRTAYLQAELYN
ncbi:hypothetical protein D9758_014056 [Tetrapyrgos nigripes]|uniref:Myb/SANT-like domain-containing protein n=1 Tax=Tetrapyrgos nigripes TaxID=182062 RepID=A0A8H5CJ64_9AGAR|nr:hypothetical protein D9758_014056 [Tetrapyrgos nigripes]